MTLLVAGAPRERRAGSAGPARASDTDCEKAFAVTAQARAYNTLRPPSSEFAVLSHIRRYWRVALALALAVALLLAFVNGPSLPADLSPAQFADGASTETRGEVTVTVRALTDAEAVRAFGGSLNRRGIQAVWISITNGGERGVRFLPILTDPDYFAPQEVAQQLHGWLTPRTNAAIDARLSTSAMPLYIAAKSTANGFVLTHADGGLKLINVGLVRDGSPERFRFVARIPGREYAVQRVDFTGLYASDARPDLDLAALRSSLESLPCCVTDRAGSGEGDPVNLVIVGDWIDTMFPFAARGWRLNEPVDATSSLKMAKAFVLGASYDTAPVSPLYLFGRFQDVAFQKARSSVSRRNHLRLWLAPFTYQGRAVWVGQISRDIGIKFTTTSWYLTTHRISPYVDEERDYLVQDLLLSGLVDKVGYVKGVRAATADAPRHNLAYDPYQTDGLRLVVLLNAQLRSPLEVEFLPWERPTRIENVP